VGTLPYCQFVERDTSPQGPLPSAAGTGNPHAHLLDFKWSSAEVLHSNFSVKDLGQGALIPAVERHTGGG
jgi:hypothetical protein